MVVAETDKLDTQFVFILIDCGWWCGADSRLNSVDGQLWSVSQLTWYPQDMLTGWT